MQVLAARVREMGNFASLKGKVAWELGAEKVLTYSRYLQDCRERREAVEEVFLIMYGNS